MSDSMADVLKHLRLARLGRYAYPGLLAAFLAAAFRDQFVGQVVTALGSLLTPLVVVALGGAIHAFYRHVAGELIIYPLHHRVHDKFDQWKKRPPTDSYAYLIRELHVPVKDVQVAYFLFRDKFGDDRTREEQDIAHTELHALWVTALVFIGAVFLKWWLAPVGVIVGVAALLGEIHQHSLEVVRMRAGKEQLKADLEAAKLLPAPRQANLLPDV
jgi:hypothetical protein